MADVAADPLARYTAEFISELSAADRDAAVADLHRQFLDELLDAMAFQITCIRRFLARRDDGCAERTLAAFFDRARAAAKEMRALRDPSASAGTDAPPEPASPG